MVDFKNMPRQKRFFYISAFCSCCLSLYIATYLTLLSFIAVALCSVTFSVIFIIESIKDNNKNWKKKEFFKYFLIATLGFHLTAFYHASAEICYNAEKKDQMFVDFDTFFFGKIWPKGQISLWLDQHPYLNPDTKYGKFLNTFFQCFYMIYFLIPIICVFGHPLIGCIKETIKTCKNNGTYSNNYNKAWNEMYFFGACFINSYMPVIFGNTLFPAWSPRLYLEKDYTRELKFYYLIQKISLRKNHSANSFPSGHIAETSVFIYAMHLFGYKKLEIFVFICSFMITLATMILRCHYFADVCISIPIGIWAFYLVYKFGYLSEKKQMAYIELEKMSDVENNKIAIEESDNKKYDNKKFDNIINNFENKDKDINKV
jgi:hypothetical protein